MNLTLEKFVELSERYNVIPVYKEILLDIDTPLSVFLKLYRPDRFNYILESVEKGDQKGRYSFIGSSENFYIRTKGNTVEIYNRGKVEYKSSNDPIGELKSLVLTLKPYRDVDLPPFWGGYVGYVGYDTVNFYEPVGDTNPDKLGIPDLYFFLSDEVVAFDNLKNSIKIIISIFLDGEDKPEIVYNTAVDKIKNIETMLSKPLETPRIEISPSEIQLDGWKSNFTKESFCEAVLKSKKYIEEGDVIQVVLSQRFCKEINVSPVNVYRTIRYINPSPYLFYLDFKDIQVVGSSPEILVTVKDGKILTKPIAGTRPRGKDEEEDSRFKEELLNDEKERAEHLMLVDLARNDVGKVAKAGTVRVDRFMYIENYSHVMHIVSDVSGELREDLHSVDVLKSVFPVGTVSGAPKVRAMQIISELEPERRNIYAGAIGYLSFNGNLDMAIAIRTALIVNGTVYVQAGAGIVADSIPEREYEETLNKAKAMMKAIEMVSSQLTSHR